MLLLIAATAQSSSQHAIITCANGQKVDVAWEGITVFDACRVFQAVSRATVQTATTGEIPYSTHAPAPVPEDVPAIQVTVPIEECFLTMEGCAIRDANGKRFTRDDWYANPDKYHFTRQSCADKARILMHDEADPPKYYCHRVHSE
jgi:hypothetical protein